MFRSYWVTFVVFVVCALCSLRSIFSHDGSQYDGTFHLVIVTKCLRFVFVFLVGYLFFMNGHVETHWWDVSTYFWPKPFYYSYTIGLTSIYLLTINLVFQVEDTLYIDHKHLFQHALVLFMLTVPQMWLTAINRNVLWYVTDDFMNQMFICKLFIDFFSLIPTYYDMVYHREYIKSKTLEDMIMCDSGANFSSISAELTDRLHLQRLKLEQPCRLYWNKFPVIVTEYVRGERFWAC